jgi:hypothetical protein
MKNKSLAFLLSCVAATAIIGGIISKVVAENINTFTPSSTNYVNFLSAPAKRLKASIGPADMSFQLSDVNGWDGNALTSSSFGGDAYVVFHNDAGTAYEIMQIDPTTIGSSSITILNRGMSFNGDLMATSSALALTWIKNTTIVELGTDVPQLLTHAVQIGGNQTIAGVKIFSSIPGSNGTPVNPTDLVTKFYADSLVIGLSPQANTTTGGTIMFATAAQTAAGTATGTYSGHTFYLAPLNSSFSLTASTSPVGVVASGTIGSTFLLNGNYSLGSTTAQSLTSASTTLNGTTTVNGTLLIPSSTNLNKLVETIFTSSGTYIVPTGVTSIDYYVLGGGGGGGGGYESGAGTECGGGGGGSGGGRYVTSTSVTPLQIFPVIVGVGGSATGTSSYFNNTTSTGGGVGGAATGSCSPGTGGLPGTPNAATGTAASGANGGSGGAPAYIGSAGTAGAWPTIGGAGVFGGGGGGSACDINNCTAAGAGGQGLVLIFAHY